MIDLVKKIKIKLRLWKWLFGGIGEGSFVSRSVVAYAPENIKIGKHSFVNEYVVLNARTNLTIGDYVHVSPGCIINTGGLNYKKTMSERDHFEKPVTISDGVWLGSGSIIGPGVTIGENSVIGAGAVVTKDIPANSVAIGVPARVVKKITD